MIIPELSKVSVWRPIPGDSLSVAEYKLYRYKENGQEVIQKQKKTYRYAKSYRDDDKAFALLLVTHDQDKEKVEKFLDKTSKSIDISLCDNGLHEIDVRYNP